MPVSQAKLARLTPNLGILSILVCSFWLCGSIVANPILYRLVPTMGDKSIETLCHFRVLKANFFSNLYNTTPSPLLNVEFPVSRICRFLVQHWKGGRGLALNINWICNKISDMLQLALYSVNCLNYFCRPLSEVYLCELWRFPLYIQVLASLFSQKRLNARFRLICY